METTTYVAYLRQSTQKQNISGLGIEAQREIIKNHIKEKPIIAEFVETESGRKNDRPKLAKALELCRKTKSVLVVAKLDRLARSVSFISRLLESETEILFVDFPTANKLVLHIISSIAEYEAGLISQRTKQSLKAKQARGATLGKPENLSNNLEKAITNSRKTCQAKALSNPNNQRAAAMIKLLHKETTNLSHIARQLNEQGFSTAKGGKFRGSQVRVLLEREKLTQ
ncbi:MAG: recombinase family protein [Rikenellaceae bacterium]